MTGVQTCALPIWEIQFREFNAQATRITWDPWRGQPFRGTRQTLVPLRSSAHPVPCSWAIVCTHQGASQVALVDKESSCQWRRHKRHWFDPCVRKIPWSRGQQPTPVFLPGKFHGQRSLARYSPWGCEESGMTECVHVHTHKHTHWIVACELHANGASILFIFISPTVPKSEPCSQRIS